MDNNTFRRFFFRVTASHMVTYMVAGLMAFSVLDYATFFQTDVLACLMRPVTSPWVAAGPGLQVVRGLIFSVALYPFRDIFLADRRGWLMLWGLLLGLSILSTTGPAPGSVEGMIYTKIPLGAHLHGLPETVLQALAFSTLLTAWYRRPHRAWTVVMGTLTLLVILMSTAGVLVPRPAGM